MSRRQPVPPLGRRGFLRGVAGTAAAWLLSGCSPGTQAPPAGRPGSGQATGGRRRPTVRVQGGQFGLPTPFAYIAAPGYWRMSYLFDTLLWPDATGRQLPWLAARHEPSADGLAHTVRLRDARWHDDTPVTADDVVFTFEYFASHALSPLAIARPRNIAAATATDPRTVTIRLQQPDVTFVQSVLGSVPIIPKHIWSDIDDPQAATGDKTLVGSGPYRLESHSQAQGRGLYVAHDDYYLGEPYVKRIEMVQVDDQLAAVRAGELDGGNAPVEGVRDQALAPFRNNPETGLVSQPSGFAFPLYYNLDRGGPLADVRFRKACLMGINRPELVEQLLTGNGTVGSAGFLPPTNPFHVEVASYPYDPAGASQLLDAAGYRRPGPGQPRTGPDGTPLRFSLFVHDTVPPALPELVAANLQQLGIDIDRQTVDLVRLFGIKTQGNYDLLINLFPGPTGTTPNGDPDFLRAVYHSDPPNQLNAATGYANSRVDQLLDRQARTRDRQQRQQLLAEIQRLVAEDLPVAVLYYTKLFFVYDKQVFDQWYYTDGGFGPGIPDVYNKHAFVTGAKTGLEARQPPASTLPP